MSDEEEESLSEGFSASEEDEWKPGKDARGGESSDDDDSDFEESPGAVAATAGPSGRPGSSTSKKREQKSPRGIKGASVKKRKPSGQSLRSKLYNKYRPPPKTFPTSPTQNSPSASGSLCQLKASKNAKTPNESNNADSSSDSDVEEYLVNPADINLRSSFFIPTKKSPAPQFDCNAGITNLSDSGSEDNNDSSMEDNTTNKAFDFHSLLENMNSVEKTREALLGKQHVTHTSTEDTNNAAAMDVNALLALGENQNYAIGTDTMKAPKASHCHQGTSRSEEADKTEPPPLDGPSRLSKTKSTRIKRHTKTRPASTVVVAGDSDDSDFEEVAEAHDDEASPNVSGDLEIHVGLTSHHRTKEQKTQHELELALKRRMNRDIKDRQLLMHKVSLMCLISRSMKYNRLFSNIDLMHAALKLLPSKNAYPTERGVELKYLQSFATWFKSAIKLLSQDLYPTNSASSCRDIVKELLSQIKRKEARCKQDMIFMFIVLVRGMGMNCRLIVNLQPIALRPETSTLISIKLKPTEKNKSKYDMNDKEGQGTSTSTVKPKKVTATAAQKSSPKQPPSGTKTNDSHQPSVKSEISSEKPANDTQSASVKSLPNKSSGSKSRTETSQNSKTSIPITHSSKIKSSREEHQTTYNSSDSAELKVKPQLSRLKRGTNISGADDSKKMKIESPPATRRVLTRAIKAVDNKSRNAVSEYPAEKIGSPVIPKVVVSTTKISNGKASESESQNLHTKRDSRSRSKSPKIHISPKFLKRRGSQDEAEQTTSKAGKSKAAITTAGVTKEHVRELRPRQQKAKALTIPQLDGGDDSLPLPKTRPKLGKLQKSKEQTKDASDETSSSSTPVRKAPVLPKAVQHLRKDRRVISTDDESLKEKRKTTASDMWVEVWSEVEEQWICIDLFKGKLHCVDTIRKNVSSDLAYVFAFQDDLSIKDVTARYCSSWTTTVRKSRVEKSWLDETIRSYLGKRTKRDIREDEELRSIHSDKPLPKSIAEFKDHPLYALERHLLKFQGIYPADAPTLGFIRGEAIYSRDCVHLLHSRDIWLKSARVVKLGEEPYKIVKARPKWDRLTRTVIKDQPLEIFGYWQTQDYDPPTAENGIVPRNAYGNVELFKECMLPKKTVHLRLPGLMRVCKKLNIDCANAVIGFDFHQGACHPLYDGFIVCEEFGEVVTAAWEEDQQDQQRKEQEKYEARVYGNWKKLIKGLLIRERLKRKYNF